MHTQGSRTSALVTFLTVTNSSSETCAALGLDPSISQYPNELAASFPSMLSLFPCVG